MKSPINATQIISDATFIIINKTVLIPTNIVITVFGILTNIANIIVFVKLTTKDTMTISLTALAVSDLLFSCLTLPHFIISALVNSGIRVLWSVDLKSLQYVGFVWQRPLFHKISITITMFVSCERSLCVVKPFLVKRIFIKRRVIVIIIGIFCGLTALFLPVYVTGGLVREDAVNGTESIFVMHLAPERATAEHVVHLTCGFSLVVISQVIIVISTVFMAEGLRRHQRFRQAVSTGGQREQKKDSGQHLRSQSSDSPASTCRSRQDSNKSDLVKETGMSDKFDGFNTSGKSLKPNQSRSSKNSDKTAAEPSKQKKSSASASQEASNKEHRLIKTVFILAVIHVVLNSPVLLHYILSNIEPGYRINQRYGNLYMLSTDIAASLHCLNGISNMFIYLALNTKFRVLFKQIFGCSKT